MTDLLGRFGAWLRSVIFGKPSTATAAEEALSVEEAVREGAGCDQAGVVEPIPDLVPANVSSRSAMEMPSKSMGSESERGVETKQRRRTERRLFLTEEPDGERRIETPEEPGESARKCDSLPGEHAEPEEQDRGDTCEEDIRQEVPLAAERTGEDTGAAGLMADDGKASQTSAGEGIIQVKEKPNEAPGGGTLPGGNGQQVSGLEGVTVTIPSSPDGWAVHPGRESPFEKVGRAFIENGDLVLRLDKDPRTFYIREHDLDKALTDGEGKVRTTANSRPVGTTRLSTSGRALNIVIDETLYTIPLRWLMLVLSGKRRKAAVWRGK